MGNVVRLRLKSKAPAKSKVERKRLFPGLARAADLSRIKPDLRALRNPFRLPQFPPSAMPPKGMALDDAFNGGDWGWAGAGFNNAVNSVYEEGLVFPGYTYLAELSQRAEYRVIAETIAEESTRKWIKINSNDDDEDKTERIKELTDAVDKLKIRDCFRKISELDSLFGRSHLYLDIRDPATDEGKNTTVLDRSELQTSIGNGRDDISQSKVGLGFFKRMKAVEPVWTYPTNYNASDPLTTDWYEPDMWYVMGKQIHRTRLLKFVSKEVPDILKPAYAFGGLSTSQIAKPYIDNWLRIRQSVADIIQAFSVFVLSTDMSETLAESGDQLFQRIDLFNNLRNNKGLMVLNKDTEEFQNVSAPLGTLDSLQAQSQEHMSAVSRIPLVKLLGIQPAGLNASSEGEIRTFYDHIHAYQERFFRPNLTIILDMVMLSLWGECDPTINFEFVKLWELDEAQEASKRKTDAETDVELINGGIISTEEARKRVAADPNTPYQSLDVLDMPEPPQQEGMEREGEQEGFGNGGEEEAEAPGGELGGGEEFGRGGGSSERGVRGQGDSEDGRFRVLGSGVEDMEQDPAEIDDERPPAIKKSQRNRLTASAALTRQQRRNGAMDSGPETAANESDTGWGGYKYMEEPTRGSNEAARHSHSKYNNGQGRGRPKFYTDEYNSLVNMNEEDDKRIASFRDNEEPTPRERRGRNSADESTTYIQRERNETGDPGGWEERQERGSFVGDAMPSHWLLRDLCMAFDDAHWEESKHPRDKDGKFSGSGVVPGWQSKAKKLGFTKFAESNKGSVKLTHSNGASLVIKAPELEGGQATYEFYPAGGGEPIKNKYKGHAGKYFFAKVSEQLGVPPKAVKQEVQQVEKQVESGLTPEQVELGKQWEQAEEAYQALVSTKNKMYSALHDKNFKNQSNPTEETKGILTFGSGDKIVKVAGNGDWFAQSPGFTSKKGSGFENLNAFLAGEKGYGSKWQNGGTADNWVDDHDPKKKAEVEANKAAEANTQKEKDAAKKAIPANLAKWGNAAPKPTTDQKAAIVSYTGSAYGDMNGALRGGAAPAGKIKDLQDYLLSASFPEDTVLYRGIKQDFAKHLKSVLVKGGIFQDKGFTSSTAKEDMGFVSGAELKLKINVPKGAKGAAVAHLSQHQSEGEIIFAAGSQFRVKALPAGGTKSGKSQWIEVDLLLPDEHMQ